MKKSQQLLFVIAVLPMKSSGTVWRATRKSQPGIATTLGALLLLSLLGLRPSRADTRLIGYGYMVTHEVARTRY